MDLPTTARVERPSAPRLHLALLVLAAGLALGMAAWGRLAQPYAFHGSLIDPPAPAADFALTDQQGRTFRLSEQAGSVVLLYFGYTFCADECPTTLAELARVRERLGSQAERARIVFITVDPARDTAARLRAYLGAFGPAPIGLTGTPGALRPIWQAYGVYQAARAGLAAGPIDHTSRVYVVDTRGNLRLTFSTDADADAIVEDVRQLIGER